MKYTYLILIAAAFLFSCNQDKPKITEQVVKVKTVVVEEKNITFPIRATGKLASKKEMLLSFKTGGVIDEITVEAGERVLEDMILARLDPTEIRSAMKKAKLAVEKAERDLQRTENLFKDSVATLEQLQNARTALNLAESDLEAAQFNLRYSSITAPATGQILKKLAEENEVIAPGRPVFMFGATEGGWIVKVNLTDKDIVKVKFGDSAVVMFDSYPERRFRAYVTQLSGDADPYTGTFETEVTLEHVDEKLVSGFIGRVEIMAGKGKFKPVMPVDAVTELRGYEGFAFRVVNGKPKKTRIAVEKIDKSNLVIQSGLKPGDTIITEGVEYISEDSKINIVE